MYLKIKVIGKFPPVDISSNYKIKPVSGTGLNLVFLDFEIIMKTVRSCEKVLSMD